MIFGAVESRLDVIRKALWRKLSVDTARAVYIYFQVTSVRTRLFMLAVFLFSLTSAILAQTADEGCWAATKHDLFHDATNMEQGLRVAPRDAIRPRNLKWELPMAAATGVLIAWVDQPAARHANSWGVASASGTASNILLGSEIGMAGLAYATGCATHHSQARDAGFTALASMGYALANDLALKATFNRQYPYTYDGRGEFWEGGKSFPSGHASASFGLASALAQRYANRPLVKWTAYGLAASISLLRLPAHKHFPSDIVAGATLGYIAGRYIGSH